jgi:hypothetical protein
VPGRPAPRRLALGLALALGASAGLEVAVAADRRGAAVGRLEGVVGRVEVSPGRGWKAVADGAVLRTGDALRTGPGALVRVASAWTTLVVGPEAEITIPASIVLSTKLKAGRIEVRGTGTGIVKIETPEAEIRGEGHVIARREAEATLVAVLEGEIRVRAAGAEALLGAGEGTVVRPGQPPVRTSRLPDRPSGLLPGVDPAYVVEGETASLTWRSEWASHTVQVLPLDSDDVVLVRDVGPPPQVVAIPWIGTFRWRVAARDGRGLEGPASAEGLVCVVEK